MCDIDAEGYIMEFKRVIVTEPHKRSNTKNFQIRWRFQGEDKWHTESCKTSKLAEARRIKYAREKALNDPQYWFKKSNEATNLKPDLAWSNYTEIINGVISPSTIIGYSKTWQVFWNWAQQQKLSGIAEITPIHAATFRNWLLTSEGLGLTKNSANSYRARLLSIWSSLKTAGICADNPWLTVRPFRKADIEQDQTPRMAILPEQAARLLLEVEKLEEKFPGCKLFVMIALYTGMRLTEVESIRWPWIDFKMKIISIPAHDHHKGHTFRTKNRKKREVPLHNKLLEELQRIQPEDPSGYCVMPTMKWNNSQQHRCLYQRWWYTARAAAGLPNLKVHELRHTFITEAKRAGVPESVVMAWTGHSTASISAHYTHLNGYDASIDRVHGAGQELSPAP